MTYLLDVTPAEAVANGAQLLDEKLPGWWRKITLEELALEDCDACVCGQLAGTAAVEEFRYSRKLTLDLVNRYDMTLSFLGLTWNGREDVAPDAIGFDYEYGFNANTSNWDELDVYERRETEMALDRTMQALDHEWQLVIRARLEADKLEIAPRWREAFNPAEKDHSLA